MKLYTIKECSDTLKIDEETIRKYIREQKMVAYKVGREWRVKEEELKKFVERGVNLER